MLQVVAEMFRRLCEDDDKFVAAEAGYKVSLPDVSGQTGANALQNLITRQMSPAVVGLLEAVQIHHNHRKGIAAQRASRH